jgi:hypothetical protein
VADSGHQPGGDEVLRGEIAFAQEQVDKFPDEPFSVTKPTAGGQKPMSAYIVDKAHIDALVTVAVLGPVTEPSAYNTTGWTGPRAAGWDGITWSQVPRRVAEALQGAPRRKAEFDTGDEVGQVLVDANVASIEYRYPDTIGHTENCPGPCEPYWVEPYAWKGGRRLTALQALAAINGFEYQACERPDWEDSEAYRLLESLKASLVHFIPGYRAAADAAWAIIEVPA